MKAAYLTASSCALVLAIASCSSNTTNSGSATTTPSTSSMAAASTSAAPTTPVPDCTVKGVSVKISNPQGAAGSTVLTVAFTNSSDSTCTLDGFPGVSYAHAPDGDPVGKPATRDGDSYGPISLSPGAVATSLIRATNVTNYPAEDCAPVPVEGFRIYPPNSLASNWVAYPTTGCSNDKPNQLGVTAVTTTQ